MWEIAFQVALVNLAAALIPGQTLALVSAGIAGSGLIGGLRVMAGVTLAKLVWTSTALALLPMALVVGPTLLDGVRIVGGVVLGAIGLARLSHSVRAHTQTRTGRGTVRVGFAGSLASPVTSIFFLSAFPAMAAPLHGSGTAAMALCLLAIALSSVLGLLPWFGLGLVVHHLSQRALLTASGAVMLAAGTALAVSAL